MVCFVADDSGVGLAEGLWIVPVKQRARMRVTTIERIVARVAASY